MTGIIENVECNEKKKSLFNGYSKQIDELYTFRDRYYLLNQETTNADDRLNDLNKKLNEIAHELENIETSQFESKACHLILIGKAFNVLPDFNQRAFDALTKAIKLDPRSTEAWNYLGESYWKKRDFEMCRNCFERSRSIQPNKMSLRGLAMVTRQLINVPASKEQLIKQQQQQQATSSDQSNAVRQLLDESIAFAKEAIKLDAKDGMSWYILGNCYMAKFFSPFGQQQYQQQQQQQQSANLLKQALSAYELALKDDQVAALQSDLHFNKSMLAMYEENWADALGSLAKAVQLDPYWTELRENLLGLLSYLDQINESVRQRGKLKPKKFQQLVESINKSELGPYGDGGFLVCRTSSETDPNKMERVELIECAIRDLKPGLNRNKVLSGKVISGSPAKFSDQFNLVCFTCCIADKNGDCASLTIYNLAGGEGLIIGHSVAIPEPWFEQYEFAFEMSSPIRKLLMSSSQQEAAESKEFKFSSIRVENPAVLVVNGKKWTKNKVSSSFFVPKIVAD